MSRNAIGQAFKRKRDVWPARATYRRRRHQVCQDYINREVERLECIWPWKAGQGCCRQDETVGRIGAVIVDAMAPDSAHPSVIVKGDAERPYLAALLCRGDKVFLAVLDPFDRSPSLHRGERNGELFRIDIGLWAKAAANIRRHHADLVLIAFEVGRKMSPHHVGRL